MDFKGKALPLRKIKHRRGGEKTRVKAKIQNMEVLIC